MLQIKKINCQSQLIENTFLIIQGFVISGERKYRQEKLNPSLMSLTLVLINMEYFYLDMASGALTYSLSSSILEDLNEHEHKSLLNTNVNTELTIQTHTQARTHARLLFPMASLAIFICGARLLTFLKAWLH